MNEQGELVKVGDDADGLQRTTSTSTSGPRFRKSKITVENGAPVHRGSRHQSAPDVENSYVSAILPIGDQAALEKFIIFDAIDADDDLHAVPPNNGCRRIPLTKRAIYFRQVSGAAARRTSHMRIWPESRDFRIKAEED